MPDGDLAKPSTFLGGFGRLVLAGVLMLAMAPLVPFLAKVLSPARVLLLSGLLGTLGTAAAALGLAGAGLAGKQLPDLARVALVIAGAFVLLL